VKPHTIWLIGAVLIGAALFFIRHLSFSFPLGTVTAQHPYIAFTATLMLANFIWLSLIVVTKRWAVLEKTAISPSSSKTWIWGLLGLSLAFRAMFFGSIPIYEDDWNRYLWDGASVSQGVSPYKYSPTEIIDQIADGTITDGQKIITPKDNTRFIALGDDGYITLLRVNNPDLTTIYPPTAQVAFGLAAILRPFDINGLRFVFLIIEAVTMFLLIKALTLYGRSPLWVLLYAFNPLLIYSAFNVAHMDVILPPFIIAALILIQRRPYLAAIALAGAAAVKVWPLILAPILYRDWVKRPVIYVSAAIFVALLSLALFWPMITELRPSSGLSAYSQNWQRSSFLFPVITQFLDGIISDPSRFARLGLAAVLTLLSLWFGFGHLLKPNDANLSHPQTIPRALLIVTLTFLFLSPTGYPWYVIWVIMFLPFMPYYGAAMLCVLVPLYYVRYALGEQGRYDIYTSWLVPLQFGLPMLILLFEYCLGQIRKPRAEIAPV